MLDDMYETGKPFRVASILSTGRVFLNPFAGRELPCSLSPGGASLILTPGRGLLDLFPERAASTLPSPGRGLLMLAYQGPGADIGNGFRDRDYPNGALAESGFCPTRDILRQRAVNCRGGNLPGGVAGVPGVCLVYRAVPDRTGRRPDRFGTLEPIRAFLYLAEIGQGRGRPSGCPDCPVCHASGGRFAGR